MTETTIRDKDLGEVLFCWNARAKYYSIRVKNKKVRVVIPARGNLTTAKRFFEDNKDKIAHLQSSQEERKENIQRDNELLAEARVYLPARLKELADLHGFTYNRLTLRNSRTRWGSCSSKKNINLSIYLMKLPKHLIDYVILHELCHLIHMNHSPAFWALLDTLTNNRAKALRKEMKQYTCA